MEYLEYQNSRRGFSSDMKEQFPLSLLGFGVDVVVLLLRESRMMMEVTAEKESDNNRKNKTQSI